MRRNKPWFGPMPAIGKLIVPVSWEGYAVTLAFVLIMVFAPEGIVGKIRGLAARAR